MSYFPGRAQLEHVSAQSRTEPDEAHRGNANTGQNTSSDCCHRSIWSLTLHSPTFDLQMMSHAAACVDAETSIGLLSSATTATTVLACFHCANWRRSTAVPTQLSPTLRTDMAGHVRQSSRHSRATLGACRRKPGGSAVWHCYADFGWRKDGFTVSRSLHGSCCGRLPGRPQASLHTRSNSDVYRMCAKPTRELLIARLASNAAPIPDVGREPL